MGPPHKSMIAAGEGTPVARGVRADGEERSARFVP